MKKISLACGLLLASSLSHAALMSADFRTESDLPAYSVQGALVYESLEQSIRDGNELVSGDFRENPSGWRGGVVFMDFNSSNNVLTLDSQDTMDFLTFDAFVSNINFDLEGEYISGISLLSNNLVSPLVTPVLSFTADSFQVSYDGAFDFTGDRATFQIETSVPAPLSFSLLGLALCGMGWARKKKAA